MLLLFSRIGDFLGNGSAYSYIYSKKYYIIQYILLAHRMNKEGFFCQGEELRYLFLPFYVV